MNCIDDVIKIYTDTRNLYSATIELTYTCNWKCRYCYLASHNEPGLETDVIKRLLLQLREIGCFDLAFTGGEIFTRSDIFQLIEYARGLGFAVTLLTNLSLLTTSDLDRLKDMHIEGIDCSIFSLNPLVHDDFAGCSGSFSKVYYNLFYCQKINLPIRAGFFALTINNDELPFFTEFIEQYNLTGRYDCRVFPKMNCDLTPVKYGLSGETLSRTLAITDKIMGVEYTEKNNQYLCQRSHISIVITPTGDVRTCSLLVDPIGNILQAPISSIVSSTNPLLVAIQELTWSDLTSECGACDKRKYCIYCPAIALLEKRKWLGKSPSNCNFAEARRRLEEKNYNEKTHN